MTKLSRAARVTEPAGVGGPLASGDATSARGAGPNAIDVALADDRVLAHLRGQLDALELRATLRAADQEREYNAVCARWAQHHDRARVPAADWAVFCRSYYQHEAVAPRRKAVA